MILTLKINAGELMIDEDAMIVRLNNKEIHLTNTEYRLLKELVSNINKVITYDQLLFRVWGEGFMGETQYLHEYVHRIRGKIEQSEINPKTIININRVGYRFVVSEE
jgi:DNA-binding response OmpR family regulator